MSDGKSKAERLADGKKKLKKFQSKNQHGKPKGNNGNHNNGPVDVVPEKEADGPVNQLCNADEPAVASQLFAPAAVASNPNPLPFSAPPASTIFDNLAASVVPSVSAPAEASPFDQIASIQSQNRDNFTELSQKFEKLEADLGITSSDGHSGCAEATAELHRKYEAEKQRAHQLEVRLRDQYSNVDALKLELQRVQLETVAKVNAELAPLRDELDNHVRTVAILVGEKAELKAALNATDSANRNRDRDSEELQAKLNASRHQVQELKQEVAAAKKAMERQQSLAMDAASERSEMEALRLKLEMSQEQVVELKRRLELRDNEMATVERNLQEQSQLVGSLQLRLAQLSGNDDEGDIDGLMRDRAAEANAQQQIVMAEQVQELLRQVEKANADRDAAATHYQNYVQQLNGEREGLVAKVLEITQERDSLKARDTDLVRHISELERQLQQQLSMQAKATEVPAQANVATSSESGDANEQLVEMTNTVEVLQAKLMEERENVARLSATVMDREQRVTELEGQVERLQHSHVDPLQVGAQLESEKVAASRAMAQNQELRAQLDEMQTAFVQMTNDKATLMTELESERYLGREMRQKYVEAEGMRQQLHYKDEEMIRLTHESTNQQKEILVLQQELAQLRHLELNKRNHSHLQQEIQKQRDQIARLQAKIQAKEEEVSVGGVNGPTEGSSALEVSVAEEVNEELKADADDGPIGDAIEVQVLPTEEAMVKLQERFTQTMSEIAELTEEKQRLEHLVVQLQGETETIGEYIALYQSQRKLLRQREIEKDMQVQQITADREEMKDKLVKLNDLVELMLKQRQQAANASATNHQGDVAADGSGAVAVIEPAHVAETQRNASKETAEQILNLLTDIKTSNLNTNFLTNHMTATCSCCSGQLITV